MSIVCTRSRIGPGRTILWKLRSRNVVVHPNPRFNWLHSMRLRLCNLLIVASLRGHGTMKKHITLQHDVRHQYSSEWSVHEGRLHVVLRPTHDEGCSRTMCLPDNLTMDITRGLHARSTIYRWSYLPAALPKQPTTIRFGRCRRHPKNKGCLPALRKVPIARSGNNGDFTWNQSDCSYTAVVGMHKNCDTHLLAASVRLCAAKAPWIWSADSRCGDIRPKKGYQSLAKQLQDVDSLGTAYRGWILHHFSSRLGSSLRGAAQTGVPIMSPSDVYV